MSNVTHLYLIRHGQSAGNAAGRFGGHSATPLSNLGLEQAKLTAEFLARENVSVVYSSDLHRAVQSAEPLAALINSEVKKHSAFRERNVGVLEGLTFDEAKQNHPHDFNALVNREVGHVITKGESYEQLLKRATCVLQDILEEHTGQRIAIYSHTGTICFLTLDLLGATQNGATHAPWLVTSNCGINRFEFRGRKNLRVLAINDTRHLHTISGNQSFLA
jgi:broad specificity phosphatase PhoE